MPSDWEIAVVYDSDGRPGYQTGWGFSAVVSSGEGRVLFDTGWDGRVLRHNLGRMGLTFADMDKVVISHAHWDHLSGLTEVLSEPAREEPLEVFVPASFSDNLKKEIAKRAVLREVDGPQEVMPGIMSTGELGGPLKEQSLVVVDGGSGIVVTGCAHPGLGVIINRVEGIAHPSWIIGGLHGAKAAYFPRDLDRLVLCHCTKEKNAIMAEFPGKVSIGRAGDVFHR